MEYRENQHLTKSEAEIIFGQEDIDKICNALVDVVHCESDQEWLTSKCLEFTYSDELPLVKIGITCLGHVARLFGSISNEAVGRLKVLRDNKEFSGKVEDALDDIRSFTKFKSISS